MKKQIGRLLAMGLALCLSFTTAAWALTPEQAYELLSYYYVDRLPEGIENMDTVEEMVAALKDPYTVYMTPQEKDEFVSSVDDSTLVGIGVAIQIESGGVRVTSVLDGSPALRAGLVAGDLIVAADGVSLAGMGDAARDRIRGEAGTQVTITVQRESGEVLSVTLTRQMVVIPKTTVEVLDDSCGYIQCKSFGSETAEHFLDGMEAYDDQVDHWVVDLRSNPGGTTNAAATSAAYFIGDGTMVYFRDGDGNYRYTYTLPDFPKLTEKPAMVLLAPYSASGSELFAGAVRDYGVATLVGQRSYGKGVAQTLLSEDNYPELFQNGEALKVTRYRFYSPDGTTNDKMGVLPHLLVSDETATRLATWLSGAAPERAEGHLRLTVDKLTWYLDLSKGEDKDSRAALAELLEAVSPDMKLERGSGASAWTETAAEALAEELGLTVERRTFSDLEQSPYAREIEVLACQQILAGDGDGTFRPKDTITRGELACLLNGLIRGKAVEGGYFTDVKDGAWYANGVNVLYEMGVISGYEDGTFRPEQPVTQEELIAVLAQFGRWMNMNLYDAAGSLSEEIPDALSHFSEWAQPSALLCQQFGLLWKEPGELEPQKNALREETAAMLYRMLTAGKMLPADCRE